MSHDVADLPLIECPVAGRPMSNTVIIFMSGDGGWARFDRSVAQALVAAGLPVIGWSALRYLWRERSPDAIAADLTRLMAVYKTRWQCTRFGLVGFSRGADLLPFAYNRLAPERQAEIAHITLLGVTARAGFGYRVMDWLGPDTLVRRLFGPPPGERDIAPEIARLSPARTTVINGVDDAQAITPGALAAIGHTPLLWPGGHHIGHAHDRIAARIRQGLAEAGPAHTEPDTHRAGSRSDPPDTRS